MTWWPPRLRPGWSRRGCAASLGALALLAGCGRTEPTTVTVAPTATVGTATTPLATAATPTTVVTVDVATSTTGAATTSTSTSTSTSSTTTSSTSTSTTVPAAAELVLGDDRLGTALFGADPDAVISYLSAVLGPPLADSGWADPNSAFGVCPGTEVRGVTWGDLLVLFSDASNVATGRRHFFAYTLGPPVGAAITPAGLATPAGIGVGSTVAELKSAYPGVYVYGGDDIFGPYFVVSENLTGFLSGDDDTDTVQAVIGGITCGE